MAKIKDILSIQLEDDIKSVIDLNSQSDENILEELNGFILTESLAKHLFDFCDLYRSGTKQSGLWLSGFYGSGKSYFAKMVGLLLDNRPIVGTPMRERFVPKLQGLKDADLLENSIESLGRTPNHVVLFDSAKENGDHSISYMMMAAFLRSLGFSDNIIGFWEYDLYINGQYADFLQHVEEATGKPWAEARKSAIKVVSALKAGLKAIGFEDDNYEETKKLFEQRMQTYDANKLRADLQRYLELKGDARIVFMVDEVSEAITQHRINLLDLEGMAEALADSGQRIWTIAIAQQRLDDVINSANVDKNKLTKIRDRFKNHIDIKAEEVETIIRHRLLAKNDAGEKQLKAYFEKNSGMIGDLTNINATNLKKTTSAQTYADYYPFFEHQFKMLQYFLFGTQTTVKTQTGTRGMLLSAFDILKKEAVKEEDVTIHVNAAQLCRQAEDNVSASLNNRYEQAAGLIKEPEYKYVKGRDLLQTIHFLTQAEVISTNADNIAKSYVSSPDDYYSVKAEVSKALDQLKEANILILTANQYRITSEIEQRIIGDLNSFTIPGYRVKAEAVKTLKNLPITRHAGGCMVDAINVDFAVKTNNDEPLSALQNSDLNIVFHEIFAAQGDRKAYIEQVKEDTQANKNRMSLIPDTSNANEIYKLIEQLAQMNDLKTKSYATPEEKDVQARIVSAIPEKQAQVNALIAQAYNHATLVYCYNTALLCDDNFKSVIDKIQRQMYNNIYTRRLSAQLSDSLATKVLKCSELQLMGLFSGEDFKFFDSQGHFVGEQLSVVTEIMTALKGYVVGADLEKTLSGPPTGYNYGTLVTTLAALFRANKIIVKHGGTEYHAASEEDSHVAFSNSKQFAKASFKAVAKSLTYKEKQEIVEVLKDDCHYQKWTGEQVNYKMNDYELVDAIRTLSREISGRIFKTIMGDDELEKKFQMSVAARNVFAEYSHAVTDTNYFATAKQFLDEDRQEDYIKAVEHAAKDLKFINEDLPALREKADFIAEVEDELDKSACDKSLFTPLKEKFNQMYAINIVANANQMAQITQQVKDHYFSLMKHYAEEMSTSYADLSGKLEELQARINYYPAAWNKPLLNQIDGLLKVCQKNQVPQVVLNGFSTKCAKSGLMLRDMVYAINQVSVYETQLTVMETEIVTTDPTPQPVPQPTPQPGPTPAPQPKPKVRSMKQQMPSGHLSVGEYRQWLKQQLTLLNGFGATDSLDFDN